MPAVSVLPLGSTTISASYSDVASKKPVAAAVANQPQARSNYTEGMNKSAMESSREVAVPAPEEEVVEASKVSPEAKAAKGVPGIRSAGIPQKSGASAVKDSNVTTGTASPSQSSSSIPQAIPVHGTPQHSGYYVAYNNTQVTPEPPSPHTTGATVYDVGSFFQQGGAAGFHNSPFPAIPSHPYAAAAGQPHPPNSPNSASIPPASPLFPRITNPSTAALLGVSRGELSPGPPYVSSVGSTDDFTGWNDSRLQSPYPQSPQISAQGMAIPYVPGMPLPRAASDRSASFDDSMLPPSADCNSGHARVTLFAHQQNWGYGPPPPDMYGASSPLQPRPTIPYPGQLGAPPRHHHHAPPMSPYGGQYYPAASPGPPIQTTTSNKGPDGANLFIFHIPNHFTNLDMYQLFYPYGNLLSVRIMVEKDTGRSRGFGFVSYDSPDAAALAIKELNGYAIGNKRLKVQHKQIRAQEQFHDPRGDGSGGAYGDHYDQYHGGSGAYGGRGMNLPPSGPMAAGWYNNRQGPHDPAADHGDPDVRGVGVNTSYEDPAVPPNEPPSQGEAGPGEKDDQGAGSDPLSDMEPLRQTLPDVGGAATSAAAGEN